MCWAVLVFSTAVIHRVWSSNLGLASFILIGEDTRAYESHGASPTIQGRDQGSRHKIFLNSIDIIPMWLPGAEYDTRRDRTLKPAGGPSGEMLLLLLKNGSLAHFECLARHWAHPATRSWSENTHAYTDSEQ